MQPYLVPNDLRLDQEPIDLLNQEEDGEDEERVLPISPGCSGNDERRYEGDQESDERHDSEDCEGEGDNERVGKPYQPEKKTG